MNKLLALVGKPPLFDLKIVYSYVLEVADSESDLGLHGRALVSEIFAFYHFLEYARGRHQDVVVMYEYTLVTIFQFKLFFSKLFNNFYVYWVHEGVCRVFYF